MINKELVQVFSGLVDLRESPDIALPARTSYAVTRNLRALQPIVEDIENERMKVLKAKGIPVEDKPGVYQITMEAKEELDELDTIDTEVKLLRFKLADFGDINLPVKVIDALYPLIDEAEEG